MTSQQKTDMHHEHREASLETNSWLDDIYMWRAEHKQAIAWLAQIESAIHGNDAKLQHHCGIVEKQERHIRQHEHAIAMNEQSGKYKDQSALDTAHKLFNEIQAKARKDHARLGELHRQQIAHVKHLLKELEGGAE